MSDDASIRRSSDQPFPHGWGGKLCYIELRDGQVRHLRERGETRAAVRRALAGDSVIYCAWPGQWRTDLFLIDDLTTAAAALGVK